MSRTPSFRRGGLHAQFELIHPFLYGNGRVGRLFIPLYLCRKTILQRPYFFISEYFKNTGRNTPARSMLFPQVRMHGTNGYVSS